MGTWSLEPFANDDAADFLVELREASPAQKIEQKLRAVVEGEGYLELDEGCAAWAACELVALSFGYGDLSAIDGAVMDLVVRVKPKEAQRELALAALSRLGDMQSSELSELWHEEDEGEAFESNLDALRKRLEAAGSGARVLPKAKKGDVIVFPADEEEPSRAVVAVQVVSNRELVVFDGVFEGTDEALTAVDSGAGRRIPGSASQLFFHGKRIANLPFQQRFKGRKLYVDTSYPFGYFVSTPSGGYLRDVTYEEACTYDGKFPHCQSVDDVRAVAQGKRRRAKLRSVEEREADMLKEHAEAWAERRAKTSVGPFGDPVFVKGILERMEQQGVGPLIEWHSALAEGRESAFRPNEPSERTSYFFVAMVTSWRGTWPEALEMPREVAGRLPAAPNPDELERAVAAARVLVDEVITLNAALRLIWKTEGGALETIVAALRESLHA